MSIKICLDAGHYGKYNRSPVVKTYYESDMNWKLHLLLKKYLEEYGVAVITTRTAQANDLALGDRGRASKGCNLFISIHSNACDTERVDRPVGIYFVDDDCGKIDEDSQKIAKLLAETVREVMQTRDEAKTYSRAASFDRDKNGRLDDEYYGVLRGAHDVGTTGVILEHSFHTNTRSAKWLLNDSNLDKLAKAEAAALAKYYGLSESVQDGTVEKDTADVVEVPTLKKGDVVTFTGKKHYSSANSKNPVPCKPGKATITLDPYFKGKHPYHLVAVKGGTSNVYGWVDAEDIYEAQPHENEDEVEEFVPYIVRVTASALNIRKGAGTSHPVVGCIVDKGAYTIVAEDNGWGKLKSGAGWISLAYTKRV